MNDLVVRALEFLRRLGSYLTVRFRHLLLNYLILRSRGDRNLPVSVQPGNEPDSGRELPWYSKKAVRALSSYENCSFHRIVNTGSSNPLYNPSILKVSDSNFMLVATQSNRVMSYRWGRRPKFVTGHAFASDIVVGTAPGEFLHGAGTVSLPLQPLSGLSNVAADARLFLGEGRPQILWNQGFAEAPDKTVARLFFRNIDNLGERSATTMMPSPYDLPTEKNWMPVIEKHGKAFRFIHTVSPTVTVSRFDEGKGDDIQWHSVKGPASLSRDRGGSQLVQLPSGAFLAVTHTTFLFPARHYSQRLVMFRKLGDGFHVVSHSQPFVFKNNFDVEFGSGLAFDGDNVLMTFGVRDLEAWVCKLPMSLALALASEVTVSTADKD